MIKKLIWLIKHQEELQKIIEKPDKKDENDSYSIAGVPDFQKKYVDDLLSGKLSENK